jgi:hypothetical protein
MSFRHAVPAQVTLVCCCCAMPQVKRQPPNEEMSCVWERFLQDIDSCPDCLLMEMLSLGMITSPVYYAHVGQRSQVRHVSHQWRS